MTATVGFIFSFLFFLRVLTTVFDPVRNVTPIKKYPYIYILILCKRYLNLTIYYIFSCSIFDNNIHMNVLLSFCYGVFCIYNIPNTFLKIYLVFTIIYTFGHPVYLYISSILSYKLL